MENKKPKPRPRDIAKRDCSLCYGRGMYILQVAKDHYKTALCGCVVKKRIAVEATIEDQDMMGELIKAAMDQDEKKKEVISAAS